MKKTTQQQNIKHCITKLILSEKNIFKGFSSFVLLNSQTSNLNDHPNASKQDTYQYAYRECDRQRELAPFSNMTSKTLSTINFSHGNYFKTTNPNQSYSSAQVEINPIQQPTEMRLSVQYDEQIIERKVKEEIVDSNIDLSIVYNYSKMTPSTLSVSTLVEFVENSSINSLILSSGWLLEELRIRLAQQVQLLDEMPYGLNLMPSIRIVRDWYLTSFKQVYEFKTKPRNRSEEIEFTNMIRTIYDRHNPTMVSVAGGVAELKEELKKTMLGCVDYSNYSSLRDHLDSFYINRIDIRTLLEHHISLHDQVENPNCNLSKLICKHTNPQPITNKAIKDAQDWCLAQYGKFPQVVVSIHGNQEDLSLPCVPTHLMFQLIELLINSMRAVVENHSDETNLPPLQILMSSSQDEVTIRISDQGKGIPRKAMPQLFSYLYSTASVRKEIVNQDGKQGSVAGFGFGLPLVKLYSKYWGGKFKLNSVSGYGTDAYLYFSKQ